MIRKSQDRQALDLIGPPISSTIQERQAVIHLPWSMTEPDIVKNAKAVPGTSQRADSAPLYNHNVLFEKRLSEKKKNLRDRWKEYKSNIEQIN